MDLAQGVATCDQRDDLLLENPEVPDFAPSRVPLIVTLALRRALGPANGPQTS